jgi:methionyl-tRNA formyltransferase
MKIAFFGSSRFSVTALDQLKEHGILPSLIITSEDKPRGRNLVITPPEPKVWAQENDIEFFQPKSLKDASVEEKLKQADCDVFVVASYGKMIPLKILEIPKYKTLNIHPSLLPKLRGASPIQSAILG